MLVSIWARPERGHSDLQVFQTLTCLWHQRVQQCNAARRECGTLRASEAKREREGSKLTPHLRLGDHAWALSRMDIPPWRALSEVIYYWKQDQAAFLGAHLPGEVGSALLVAPGRVGLAVPSTQALWAPSRRSSFPARLPRTALPARQSQAAAPSQATCCLVWWSSWWAFPGLHPTGLSLPPRWWCVLTGGVRPVANEGNCSWNYFLNIGSLVPLHLENKPRFLISLSTVCELRTTLAHQKWSCSYCTTWWYFFLNPYSILELQSLF